MRLLEEDEEYLTAKGYEWELRQDGDSGWLLIRGYPLAEGRFDHPRTDLLIRIPPGYNNAKLDMFYVQPHLKLAATDRYPDCADEFALNFDGRQWQRFSRHLNDVDGATWKAGVDNLRSFLALVNRDLR